MLNNFIVVHRSVSDKKLYYSDDGSMKNEIEIEDIILILL